MGVRFDAAARRAIDLATREVERLGHDTLEPGHLVLGLVDAGGPALTALVQAGADPGLLRAELARLVGPAGTVVEEPVAVDVETSAEEILQRAAELAAAEGAREVSDVDILRAAAERRESPVGRALAEAGATPERLAVLVAATPEPLAAVGERNGGHPGPVTRVGVGYDSHRFAPGGPMRLGGVDVPGEEHLAGHSDGDAIAHAITDAVLGAAAAGDIGEMFADTDPANRGRDSIEMLRLAVERVREGGWRVQQVDVTVVAERPRIGPHRDAMRRVLASALGVQEQDVGLKGKSNEGLGWIGRGEGLACIAVATLVK